MKRIDTGIDRVLEGCPAWAWLVPPALLACVVFILAVDVFNWDEWLIWGELLHKLDSGTFSLADLAAQQNEQRNMAARVFGLLLMPVSGLNRFHEFGLNIALAGVSLFAALALYRRTLGETRPCVWLIFSMLAFSTMQWEAFTVGINSSIAILPVGLWLGLLIAQSGNPTIPRLAVLGVIGILPSFSFANGLFYWFCLLPIIGHKAYRQKTLGRVLPIWLTMTVAAWGLYFHGFESPGHHPSLLSGLEHPVKFIGYFLAYIGGAISSDKNLYPTAVLLGLGALSLFASLAWNEWRAGGDRRERLLPWLAAALFTLASAGVTTLARCAFGIEQALESRYATFSSPFWMALAALAFMSFTERPGRHLTIQTKRFMALSMAVFLLSTLLSTIVFYNRHDRFANGREALFTLTDEASLKPLFPDAAYIATRLPLLLEKRVSVFRDVGKFSDYKIDNAIAGRFALKGESSIADGRVRGVTISGTVPEQGGESAMVLLAVDGMIVAVLPDAAAEWEMFIPLGYFPGQANTLKAYALKGNGNTVQPLAPANGFEVIRGELEPVEFTYQSNFYIKN